MNHLLRAVKATLIPFTLAIACTQHNVIAQEGSLLDQAFRRVDSDGDGKLSNAEVTRFARLKDRLKGADKDGDEFVSLTEFRRQITAAEQRLLPSTGKLSAGDGLRIVKVGEVERRYRVHVPKSYDASKPTPVVIAFHGGGGNPESMIRLSGLNEKSDQAGFIVVYPYGSGRDPDRSLTFNGGGCCGFAQRKEVDDISFVKAILDDLQRAANVDTQRIFATGMSNGAIMAYYVASELADRIAAIAPVGGPMMTETCNPTRPVVRHALSRHSR